MLVTGGRGRGQGPMAGLPALPPAPSRLDGVALHLRPQTSEPLPTPNPFAGMGRRQGPTVPPPPGGRGRGQQETVPLPALPPAPSALDGIVPHLAASRPTDGSPSRPTGAPLSTPEPIGGGRAGRGRGRGRGRGARGTPPGGQNGGSGGSATRPISVDGSESEEGGGDASRARATTTPVNMARVAPLVPSEATGDESIGANWDDGWNNV